MVASTDKTIDGAQETDGLTIHSGNFGDPFSSGLVVVQDGFNRYPTESQNFKYIAWSDIAKELKLKTD